MTKAEIVNEISLKTGTDRKEALQIVEGVMDSVKKSLVNGENVYLRGFDSFTLKRRAEKVARNITNNTTILFRPMMFPTSNRLEILHWIKMR